MDKFDLKFQHWSFTQDSYVVIQMLHFLFHSHCEHIHIALIKVALSNTVFLSFVRFSCKRKKYVQYKYIYKRKAK